MGENFLSYTTEKELIIRIYRKLKKANLSKKKYK
jgi:hypothetical protein